MDVNYHFIQNVQDLYSEIKSFHSVSLSTGFIVSLVFSLSYKRPAPTTSTTPRQRKTKVAPRSWICRLRCG